MAETYCFDINSQEHAYFIYHMSCVIDYPPTCLVIIDGYEPSVTDASEPKKKNIPKMIGYNMKHVCGTYTGVPGGMDKTSGECSLC